MPTPESQGSVPSHSQQRLAPGAQGVSNQSVNVVLSVPHNEGSLLSAADKVQGEKERSKPRKNETDSFEGE